MNSRVHLEGKKKTTKKMQVCLLGGADWFIPITLD